MHVDLDHDVVAGRQLVDDELPRRALQVAVDLEPLEESAGIPQLLELFARDEVIVDAVHFAGPAEPVDALPSIDAMIPGNDTEAGCTCRVGPGARGANADEGLPLAMGGLFVMARGLSRRSRAQRR